MAAATIKPNPTASCTRGASADFKSTSMSKLPVPLAAYAVIVAAIRAAVPKAQ